MFGHKGFERVTVLLHDVHAFIENIHVPAELVVVDFIVVSVVHVLPENEVQRVAVRKQVKLVKDSRKLVLAYVPVFCAVEILEVRLHEHPLVLDFTPVVLDDFLKVLLLFLCKALVLASRGKCGFSINLIDRVHGVLINVFLGENSVHIFNELMIVDEPTRESVFLK